jgi:hypothetical protein
LLAALGEGQRRAADEQGDGGDAHDAEWFHDLSLETTQPPGCLRLHISYGDALNTCVR